MITKKTITIIDDDLGMVKALQRLLIQEKMYDVKVFDLNDKQIVIGIINDTKPDLIIIDVKMRGIDGFEICSQIRKDPKNDSIKIIAISGTIEEKDSQKMLDVGANVYFEKPFDNKEFLKAIGKLLDI